MMLLLEGSMLGEEGAGVSGLGPRLSTKVGLSLGVAGNLLGTLF